MQKILHSGFNIGPYEHSKFKKIMKEINAEPICEYVERNRFEISIWLYRDVAINYKHFYHLSQPTTIYLHGELDKLDGVEEIVSKATLKFK